MKLPQELIRVGEIIDALDDKYGEPGFCWTCNEAVEPVDTMYGKPRLIPGTSCGPCSADRADKARREGE